MLQPPSLALGSAQVYEPQAVVSKAWSCRTRPAPPAQCRSPAAQHLLRLQHPRHLRLGLVALLHEAPQLPLVGDVGHLANPVSQEGRLPWDKDSIL